MTSNTAYAIPLSSISAGGLVPSSNANFNNDSLFGRRKSWVDRNAESEQYTSDQQPLQVKFVNSAVELLENHMKKDDGPKKKRTRTSPEQLKVLQSAFDADPLPNAVTRMNLAKQLGMNVRAVQIWFQNRRAKGKLDQKRNDQFKVQKPNFMSVDQKRLMEELSYESLQYETVSYDSLPYEPYESVPYESIKPVRSMSVTITTESSETLPKHLMIPSYFDIPPLSYTSPTEDTIPMMRDSVSPDLLDSPEDSTLSPLSSSYNSPSFPSINFDKGLGIDMTFPETFRRCFSMPNVHQSLASSQISYLSKSLSFDDNFKIDEAEDEALSNYIDVPDDSNNE